jgi:hypothetical protein
MGDVGSALSSGLSGLSSGVSNAFGGLSSGLSSMFGGAGSDLSSVAGDAMGGMDTSGLGLDSLFSNLDPTAFNDPTGSVGASQAMTPPADVAAAGPGTDPASTIGGSQSGTSPGTNQNQGQNQQPKDQNPLSQVWKNLQNMGKSMQSGAQKANPFTMGAGGGAAAAPGPTAPTPEQPQPGPTGTSVTAGPTPPADAGMDPEIAARQAGAAPGQAGGPGAAAATQPTGPAPTAAQPRAATPAAAPGNQGPELVGGGNVGAGPTQDGPGTAPSADLPSPQAQPASGAGGAPTAQETPTNPLSVIGPLLRDILGLALGGPSALPQLVSDLMGGGMGGGMMGGGGMPPWAMQSMMPFMRGRRGGFMGFNGGMLRPGYYPNRMNGNRFGFHQGGWHPGWNPAAFHPGGGTSGGGGASGRWSPSVTPSAGRPYDASHVGGDIPVGTGPGSNSTRADRNLNPGNIMWSPWAQSHGATQGAGNDQGHLVAVFPNAQAGWNAMGDLLRTKYNGGMRSANALIATPGRGWTPGNYQAAANIARFMGVSPDADLNLNDPGMMMRLQRALATQEGAPNLVRAFGGGQPATQSASVPLAAAPTTTAATTPTPPIRTQPWFAPGVQTNVQDASGGDAMS